jgi:hypothetical protein
MLEIHPPQFLGLHSTYLFKSTFRTLDLISNSRDVPGQQKSTNPTRSACVRGLLQKTMNLPRILALIVVSVSAMVE